MDKENNFSSARICIEMDFSNGLPKPLRLNLDGWSHLQALDYEPVLFKHNFCHKYGHFPKHCPKAPNSQYLYNPLSSSHSDDEQETFKPVTKKHKKHWAKTLYANNPKSHYRPPCSYRYDVLKSSKVEFMGDETKFINQY